MFKVKLICVAVPNTVNKCALQYFRCWISDEDGAIWAFAAPVILIIVVSMCDL